MKNLFPLTSILAAFLFLPLPLSAQPFWTEFTYTDWSPGSEPAIAALEGREAYDSATVWDGDRFVSFFRATDTEAYLSAYSSDGEDWEYLAGGSPITVTGLFGYPLGDHTVAAAPEGFPAAETAWSDQAGNVRFKLWYANAGASPGEQFQYAESTDGVNWQAFTAGYYCPPTWKTDTYRVFSRPKVLYRPRGSTELSTAAPMDNRYLMYQQGGQEDEPYYYELYISSDGLDWTLYASDWHCQSRAAGQSFYETVTFLDSTDGPAYLNSFEEVYYYGVRQGWMLWTTEDDNGPISSWYSANGWNWVPRESPINSIGSANPVSGYWNETANSRLDSIRLGTSYFFLRTGRDSSGTRQLGAGIKKGVLSAEIEDLPDRVWGDTPVNYRLFSWNNQVCPRIDTFVFTSGIFAGEAYEGTGGDGKTNLPSSIGGTPLTFVWDSTRNYPSGWIRIEFQIWPIVSETPVFQKGEPDTSNPFSVAPSPTATAGPSASPSPSATPTPEGYRTPTATPTATPTPSTTPTPPTSPTPSPSATPTPPTSPTPTATPSPSPIPPPGLPWIYDYNGDGTSDFAIFRPSTSLWAIRGGSRVYFGGSSDEPVPGDYSGDGTTEIAVYRPALGLWAVRGLTRVYLGSSTDEPVPGDYSGDGTTEIAIYRPATGLWAVRGLTRAYYGSPADFPVPGYYSGREKSEIAIFRPSFSLWAIRGGPRYYFGGFGDLPVPGDYADSGNWTPAVFKPGAGLWAVRGVTRAYFGGSADEPVPGDYGGTGIDRIAVFRETTGFWAVRGLTRIYFGRFDDIPVSR